MKKEANIKLGKRKERESQQADLIEVEMTTNTRSSEGIIQSKKPKTDFSTIKNVDASAYLFLSINKAANSYILTENQPSYLPNEIFHDQFNTIDFEPDWNFNVQDSISFIFQEKNFSTTCSALTKAKKKKMKSPSF